MNNRQRKKWLKKHGLYVNDRETWNLDANIANYILPRLKRFKEIGTTYPGIDEAITPDGWNEVLQKMINAFEILGNEMIDKVDLSSEGWAEEIYRLNREVDEGLQLFAKYYRDLWW